MLNGEWMCHSFTYVIFKKASFEVQFYIYYQYINMKTKIKFRLPSMQKAANKWIGTILQFCITIWPLLILASRELCKLHSQIFSILHLSTLGPKWLRHLLNVMWLEVSEDGALSLKARSVAIQCVLSATT